MNKIRIDLKSDVNVSHKYNVTNRAMLVNVNKTVQHKKYIHFIIIYSLHIIPVGLI